MTRKHFEALAAALKDSKPDKPNSAMEQWAVNDLLGRMSQWRADVRAIADVCLDYNLLFNDAKFYTACGYELGK